MEHLILLRHSELKIKDNFVKTFFVNFNFILILICLFIIMQNIQILDNN